MTTHVVTTKIITSFNVQTPAAALNMKLVSDEKR